MPDFSLANAVPLPQIPREYDPCPTPIHSKSICPDPGYFLRHHFKRVEITSRYGSSLGFSPVPNPGTSNYFEIPERMKLGQMGISTEGGVARDSLYINRGAKWWVPLPKNMRAFIDIYDRQFVNPLTEVDYKPGTYHIYGFDLGIEF